MGLMLGATQHNGSVLW